MRKLLALTAGASALGGSCNPVLDHPAWSQAARTIRVVISVPPGGSIDLLFRLLADHICHAPEARPFIIESRPGAGGIIAAEAVARAAPDGNTLLSNNNGMIISSILRKVNYDPRDQLRADLLSGPTPQIIVVNSASPYRTLAELVDAARAKPGELSIASVGPQHHPAHRHRAAQAAGRANMTYVPFPGGAADRQRAARRPCHRRRAELVGGWRADDRRQGRARSPPWRRSGSSRCRICRQLRNPATRISRPMCGSGWWRRPRPRRRRWRSSSIGSATALLAPEVKAKLTAQALYPNPKCGADFDAHLQRQSELYARLIRELNIKTE